MKKRNNPLSNEYFLLFFYLLLGIILFLVDSLGILSFVRSGISYVFQPIAFQADVLGSSGKEYLNTFVRLKEFKEEYNDLSISIYEKEVENSFYILLKEENEALRKQIALGGKEHKYVLSKVLSGEEYEFLNINEGENSGIAVGDVVVLGNMFVGMVTRVDKDGSLVRLATSKNNNLEVIVVRGGVEEARLENLTILTKAVVEGTSEGIRIENMEMNSDVKNGDIVVVNDSRVGEYLILGYLIDLAENPAAISKSGFVSPVMEYDKLITVFVRVDL